MKLVVIEGPGKQATIKKYLGDDYTVFASKGHVRDLPPKGLSVDVGNNFEPTYEVMKEKSKVVSELKKLAKNADEILLATDPDREGEAISWHIAHILGIPASDKCRISFNEISKSAVEKALLNPRVIDLDLVNAQQTRRILDRIVGYKLSPILNRKIASKLSAGRVQSVALKLIVDREREIQNFKPEEYWPVNAILSKNRVNFRTLLVGKNGKKFKVKSQSEYQEVEKQIKSTNFVVSKVKKELKHSRPLPPFITSTMQQDAGIKLRMSLEVISKTAQQLYEGVNITGYGKKALITYIRTDSTRVSLDAQKSSKSFILSNYGEKYAPEKFNYYASKSSAQEGHEAIRPIDITMKPQDVEKDLSPIQFKLYQLIYNRFLASQMSDATYDSLIVDIKSGEYDFKVSGRTPVFDGYKCVYGGADEVEESDSGEPLPELIENDKLELAELKSEQKFTKPPTRFTEPTFVKLMENKGIGRPATYVQTITTLFKREYCKKEGKYFIPTEIGYKVSDYLTENFEEIMNVKFTADMESELDRIAKGSLEWHKVLADFYGPFEQKLELVKKSTEEVIVTDEICPNCGANLTEKMGRNGKFLACPNFPKCKYTKSIDGESSPVVETDFKCPNCNRNLVVRTGRMGKFLACPNYPECKYTKPYIDENTLKGICPECGNTVIGRKAKSGKIFFACVNYPECKYMSWDLPTEEKCPKCKGQLFRKFKKANDTIYCVDKCGYTLNVEHSKEYDNL